MPGEAGVATGGVLMAVLGVVGGLRTGCGCFLTVAMGTFLAGGGSGFLPGGGALTVVLGGVGDLFTG